jgi:hypothetical protein
MPGVMNTTQQIFCEYRFLHVALVSVISVGEIMLAMHQVAAMLRLKVDPFFRDSYLSKHIASQATISGWVLYVCPSIFSEKHFVYPMTLVFFLVFATD